MAALWTPQYSPIAPVLWCDARDLSAGALGQWNDLSGSAHHATQPGGSIQPVIVESALNGYSMLRFGSGRWMIVDHEILLNALTVLVVTQGGADNQRVLDQRGTGAAGAVRGWHLKTRIDGDTFIVDSGTDYSQVRSVSDHTAQVRVAYYDGISGVRHRAQGVFADSFVDGDSGTPGDIDTTKRIHIGANVNGQSTQLYGGDLGTALILPDRANEWLVYALEGWAHHRWGLQADLPADHVYRDNLPYLLQGNFTRGAGGPGDAVLIRDWTTRRALFEVVPDSNGDWSAASPPGQVDITYLTAGCEPICHGPYTVAPD